jgi:putative lipoic acid-binding regulatory protein
MDKRYAPDELLVFPCTYQFKVFAAATDDDAFARTVRLAVSQVVPVGRDQLRTRLSSGGRYQCVTVGVHLENSTQLTAIYVNLRGIDGVRYLL